MSRCWYTDNKLYISGARIPYHFCFSLLVCFNNGKYFDRFSVTCYTIVENSNCWAMGNVYQFFGRTFVIFLTVSRFSIFVFWWLVFVINVFSSWQLTRLDLTGTFFELENSEPLMFRLNFVALATIEDQFGGNASAADESLKIATKQLSGVVLGWFFLLLSLYH